MNINLLDHPLVKHKIALLRDQKLQPNDFRSIISELTSLLLYEATRSLTTKQCTIDCWSGVVTGEKIKQTNITFVPIIRAGLAMLQGAHYLIQNASISAVGLFRNEETSTPVKYYLNIVKSIKNDTAIVLDPMLATGGSLNKTIELLKEAGCKHIIALSIVSSVPGVKIINKNHPDVALYTAALDDQLDQNNFIIPGLGDAGDRCFGTAE